MEIINEISNLPKYKLCKVIWEEKDKSPTLGPLVYGNPVYDIRNWNNGRPGCGVCLDIAAANALSYLVYNHDQPYPSEIRTEGKANGHTFILCTQYGILKSTKNTHLEVNKVLWDYSTSPVWDIRWWDIKKTKFSPGVMLDDFEFLKFGAALMDELGLDNQLHKDTFTSRRGNSENSLTKLLLSYGREDLAFDKSIEREFLEMISKIE